MKSSSKSKENKICKKVHSSKLTPTTKIRQPLSDTTNKENMKNKQGLHQYNLKLRDQPAKNKTCACCTDESNSTNKVNSTNSTIKTKSVGGAAKKTRLIYHTKRSSIMSAKKKQTLKGKHIAGERNGEVPEGENVNIRSASSFTKKSLNATPTRQRVSRSSVKRQLTSNQKKPAEERQAKNEETINVNKTWESEFEYMKSVYVLIERCQEIEKKYKKRFFMISPITRHKRKSNPLAVYEFEYDKNEDRQQKQKRKRGPYKKGKTNILPFQIFDTNQPRKQRRNIRKTNKKNIKEIVEPMAMVLRKRKLPEVNEKIETSTFLSDVTAYGFQVNKINEAFDKLLDKNEENIGNNGEQNDAQDAEVFIENFPPSPLSVHEEIISEPVNIVEEVTRSFMEDCDSDESENDVSLTKKINMKSSVRILSNFQVRKPLNIYQNPKSKQQIFNSTMNNFEEHANPWRINLSAIRKNPYLFSVKEKSFTPSYDRNTMNTEYVTIKTSPLANITTNETIKSIANGKEKIQKIVTLAEVHNSDVVSNTSDENSKDNGNNEAANNSENISVDKKTHQLSILDFVTITRPKITEKLVPIKDSFLENSIVTNVATPRKVLGTLNYGHSTPLESKKPFSVYESPNVSKIASTKDDQNIDNLFGFSYLSDSDKENECSQLSPRKQKTIAQAGKPTRFSPRKLTRSLFPQKLKQVDNAPAVEEPHVDAAKIEDPPAIDGNNTSLLLFKDAEDSLFAKRPTRRYERKIPKRRRVPSIDSNDSDHEESPEVHLKKKRKDIRTKHEEDEANRLASYYNSMFEEIEQHDLCIE